MGGGGSRSFEASPAVVDDFTINAKRGNLERLMQLVAAGVHPNFLNTEGESALHVTARFGYENVTRFLLHCAPDVDKNIRDSLGWTPLHWAAKGRHAHVVRMLAQNGADLHAHTKNGTTPLMACIMSGDEVSARVLVEADKQVLKGANAEGSTALMLACERADAAMVAMLVAAGADVHARDQQGDTALHYACTTSCLQIVNELLAAGASATVPNKYGLSPLDAAHSHDQGELLAKLLRRVLRVRHEGKVTLQQFATAVEPGPLNE